MWNTIATFRENISQIASEVLDTTEDLEISGLQEAAVASHDNGSRPARSQRSGAMVHHNQNEKSGEHMPLVGRIDEEHLAGLPLLPQSLTSDVKSKWKHGFPDGYGGSNNNKNGIYSDFDASLEGMELKISTLLEREKDLSSQASSKEQAYYTLSEEHNALLAELERVKQELSNERFDASKQSLQIQSQSEALEKVVEECKLLKEDKYQMSLELAKLRERKDEDAVSRNGTFNIDFQSEAVEPIVAKDGKLVELQKIVTNLQEENVALLEEREKLLKDLQTLQQDEKMGIVDNEHCEVRSTELELLDLRSQVKQVETLSSRLMVTEEALALEKLKYQKKLDDVSMERDKALRDLSRLKQHLLDKELADSEKMDQDNEQIQELESRASASNTRVLQLEQSLSLALANQAESNKRNADELQRARIEVENLNQRVKNLLLTLDSKDVELANLQSALGQYYAESEAQDRLYGELRSSKEEIRRLLQDIRAANELVDTTQHDKEDVLGKLAQEEHKFLLSQQRIQKLEEDVSRLRHALEKSLTQLNRMSSDSDYSVDRRIVIKLLVTYFQRKHSKEVLDLMARMLGFSEEDKQRVGLAQDNAGRTVVKSVLGIPGRFVGGLLGSGIPNISSVPAENQSFADLWIDFLLKESEERDRRERAELNTQPASEVQKTEPRPTSLPGSYNFSQESLSGGEKRLERIFRNTVIDQKPYSNSTLPESPRFEYQNHISNVRGLQRAENGAVSRTEPGDILGREFLSVPLNSSVTRASFDQRSEMTR